MSKAAIITGDGETRIRAAGTGAVELSRTWRHFCAWLLRRLDREHH
jgi:hypothetical protein